MHFGPGGEVHDPQVLLRALKERSATLHAVSGSGNLGIKTPRGGANAGVNIAAERPAKLRVEVLGFFGNPAVLLATDGVRMEVYHSDDGTFAEGAVTPRALSRVVPVALSAGDLVSLLFGDPPVPTGATASVRIDPERRAYALTLNSGEVSEVVYQEPETLLPVAAVVTGPEGWHAELSDYQSYGEVRLPRHITLTSADEKTELRLVYRKLRVDPVSEAGLFELTPPKGAQIVPLEAD